jgi:hypothetical protein
MWMVREKRLRKHVAMCMVREERLRKHVAMWMVREEKQKSNHAGVAAPAAAPDFVYVDGHTAENMHARSGMRDSDPCGWSGRRYSEIMSSCGWSGRKGKVEAPSSCRSRGSEYEGFVENVLSDFVISSYSEDCSDASSIGW